MNSVRTKSADFPRTALPMEFSFKTRSSTIFIDELHRMEKEEQELNTLNNRFATYLKKIINLGDINIKLRRQIDDIHQNFMGHVKENEPIDHHLLEKEFNNIRRQLNTELRNLISFQTRFNRADYDKKYYKNQLKLFSTSDQLAIIQQQFDTNLYVLNSLKEQYGKQIEELQSYKKQYDEYTTKLIEYADEYNRIVLERMESENSCHTLEEQILFEREYNCRCKEEFRDLEKIQCDLNDQFTKEEFEKMIEKIREDYQNYNEIQLSELELLYESKLETIKKDFHQDKQEEIQPLIEQNRFLEQKLKQIEYDLHHIIEQNQQQYERLNNEYHRLELRIPEFESSIQISRHNTVHLTSEINTYRCLLTNLVQKPKLKPKSIDFTVHFGNGIIWCRI